MALRALGLVSFSAGVGLIPFLWTLLNRGTFPHRHSGNSRGHVQPRSQSVIACLTALSSRE